MRRSPGPPLFISLDAVRFRLSPLHEGCPKGLSYRSFVNVAALSCRHGWHHTVPVSRLLTFTPGSDSVRIRCYLHTSDYAVQGWYDRVEKTVTVGKPFRW